MIKSISMKFLGLIGLLMTAFFAQGQYYYLEYSGGTPGDLNQDEAYPEGSGQASGWTQILGPSVSSPSWSNSESIPFTFEFNGNAVTSFYASSTGVLTFAASPGTAPAETNVSIPDASIPDSSICVWGLMADGTNDHVSVKTFGTAPNRQHWIHWSSCTNGTNTWSYWSIVLEETTNDIFLVDQRHSTTGTGSLTCGVQINSTTAIEVSGSPTLANMAGSQAGPDDDYYYRFIFGTQPAVDVELQEFDLLPYIGNSATDISGTFINYGTNPVTAVDITWDDGTGPYTENVTGLNIPTNGTHTFTHADQLSPTPGQGYTVDLTIVATGDVNTVNNTIQKSTVSLTSIPDKYVVGEEKTGTWCGWCPRGGVGLSIMENEPKFIGIAVHNADPMEVPAYDNNIGTYIPGGYPGGGVDRVENGNPIDFDQMFAMRENEVVPCSVNSISMIYNDQTNKIEVSTEVEFFGNVTGNYRLSMVLTENNVIGDPDNDADWLQINYYDGGGSGLMTDAVSGFEWSTAGDPVHPIDFGGYDHVAVHLSDNNILGDNGSLPAGSVPAGTYTWDFDDVNASVFEDLIEGHAIVMVVNADNGEILNAGETTYDNVGIEENKMDVSLSIYPNPTSGNVNISFQLEQNEEVSVTITNMLGESVINTGEVTKFGGQHSLIVDGSFLPDGIYMVNLHVGEQIITKKLIVAK
jgi:hypothetical protein